MTIYANVEAVAEQWRRLDSRETAAAARLLDQVSALMRRYSPGLDARVAVDTDLAAVAAQVAVDAVLRVLNPPQRDSSRSSSDLRSSSVGLFLTDSEIESLALAPEDGLGQGAFTIRPGGHAPTARVCW